MLRDPSLDAAEFTTTPKTVVTEFGAGYVGHAVRCTGNGTITVTTKAGASRTLNVNDGELVPILFSAVTGSTGITGYRIHVCKPNP